MNITGRNLKVWIIMTTIWFLHAETWGQGHSYPTDYFRSPMNIPLTTSGTFAEIRNNHFHSGMDFRVGGEIGEPVYSVSDGYVSRIKVSAFGGGKTVYITHRNGFKSVYMHLNNFSGKIASYVKEYQYTNKVFEFDLDINDSVLLVEHGQQIGNAGNTGGSQGPHLHFELRYAHNDKTINPLLFGLPFNDNIAPVIHNVRVYPVGKTVHINGKNAPLALVETRTNKKTKKKYTKIHDTVEVSGRFYAGIYATDAAPQSTGRNGVFDIKMFVDGKLHFQYSPTEFMFEETRAVNTMIDYSFYKKTRQPYILSRVLRGNKAEICKVAKNRGYISFNDEKCHKITYQVSDYSGNISKFSFVVKNVPQVAKATKAEPLDDYNIPVAYYLKNRYRTDGFAVYFGENTFYENDLMKYERKSLNRPLLMTDVHTISFKNYPYPPHNAYTLKITIPDSLRSLKDKLVLVLVNPKTSLSQPFKLENDTIEGNPREFGSFALALDTVAPTVSPINFKVGKTCNTKMLRVKITDHLSSIYRYNCYITGNWVLAEYDGKTASLTINVSEMVQKGGNVLDVIVSDRVGNTTKKKWNIVY